MNRRKNDAGAPVHLFREADKPVATSVTARSGTVTVDILREPARPADVPGLVLRLACAAPTDACCAYRTEGVVEVHVGGTAGALHLLRALHAAVGEELARMADVDVTRAPLYEAADAALDTLCPADTVADLPASPDPSRKAVLMFWCRPIPNCQPRIGLRFPFNPALVEVIKRAGAQEEARLGTRGVVSYYKDLAHLWVVNTVTALSTVIAEVRDVGYTPMWVRRAGFPDAPELR